MAITLDDATQAQLNKVLADARATIKRILPTLHTRGHVGTGDIPELLGLASGQIGIALMILGVPPLTKKRADG